MGPGRIGIGFTPLLGKHGMTFSILGAHMEMVPEKDVLKMTITWPPTTTTFWAVTTPG